MLGPMRKTNTGRNQGREECVTATEQLIGLKDSADPFRTPPGELAELRLEAAREYFNERRQQVPLLDRVARENRVSDISRLSDVVPLLFAHSAYKSYPLAFVKNGHWDRMLKWLRMVSTDLPAGLNLDGITDIDDWIDRLWAAGLKVATTSSTSGKASLLPRSERDHAMMRDFVRTSPGWPEGIKPAQSRHFFMIGPKGGAYVAAFSGEMIAQEWGRSDSLHYLSDQPLRVADIARRAEFRIRLAEGTATPREIVEMEEEARIQTEASQQRLDGLLETIISLRHEPQYILGLWGPLWMLMQRARARGIADGEFHPDTIISTGGGNKGASYPADYQEQILGFFGPVRTVQSYGMSEMSWYQLRCSANRYHQVPWIIPMLLDRTGEAMVKIGHGVAEGRFGMLDVSFTGRWGGLISGDKVQIDHAPLCPCGHPGPTILPTISRYSDVGDDRIGCAGTVDSYIRGELGT